MQDNGKGGRAGDRLKVRVYAGLHRLVVIRHDRKHRVGARRLGLPRQFDSLPGRIRSRSCNDPNPATRGFDDGADDAVVLGRRQGRSLAGGFADHDCGRARFDLPFAKPGQCRQIDAAVIIERGGKIGDVAREPDGGSCNCGHRISRCVFHFDEALPIRRKHQALLASDAGLDPEAHLLQPGADFQAEAAFAGIDQDGDRSAGAEKLRYLGECRFDGEQRALTRDQADGVLPPRNPACGWWSHGRNRAAAGRETAPGYRCRRQWRDAIGKTREPDHGIGDLLAVGSGMRLEHLALPDGGCHAARRGRALAAGR